MKKRQIKSADAAIYRVEIKEAEMNRFYEIINDNQRTKQQYYTLDLDDNTSKLILNPTGKYYTPTIDLDRNWGTDIILIIRDINDSLQEDTLVFMTD
ncbi:MAG: hypothetical protein EZS28_005545 [Streblomastix strix]|uniref:Uncharacterized protein n=1 Tax=Streblomastix strix TaxID=222440 RepID=A0A5J4WX55_9EUKA|nr:MAG: hypothetical protein EZS28_005545 [Streblomastix strix]